MRLARRSGPACAAEFIRVQCALARCDRDPNGAALRAAAEVLLEEHRVVWPNRSCLANRWDWIRGFPDVVRLNAKAFWPAERNCSPAVPVRHVELLDVAGHLIRLAACPLLSGWRHDDRRLLRR